MRPLRAPDEVELAQALSCWLESNPIPELLHPMLEAAVQGRPVEEVAIELGVSIKRLDAWRRCFAMWASKTLDHAAAEVWRLALEQRRAGGAANEEE